MKAPRRILFPELRIQQLNPHIRNPYALPSLTELLASNHSRPSPSKRIADVINGSNFVLNSYPTREIVLVAKRMDYMDGHSTDQQHVFTRETDRFCKNKTEKKTLMPNRSLIE
jgi:hypothetical protein